MQLLQPGTPTLAELTRLAIDSAAGWERWASRIAATPRLKRLAQKLAENHRQAALILQTMDEDPDAPHPAPPPPPVNLDSEP